MRTGRFSHEAALASWYPIEYHSRMDAAQVLIDARRRSALSLRALAERAGTSHATLSAYESGRKTPTVTTLSRIVRAAGFELDPHLAVRQRSTLVGESRGDELAAVIELAEAFPARHAPMLDAPVFGRP